MTIIEKGKPMKIHEYQNSKTIMFDLMEKLYQEHPTEEVLERFILNTRDSAETVELTTTACATIAIQLAQLRELEKCRSRLNFFFVLSIIGMVLGFFCVWITQVH